MILNCVFPNLYSANIPHAITNIFIHVNYNEDIRDFRRVSRSWRNFIDQELLGNPNLRLLLREKRFVEAWLRNRPCIRQLAEIESKSKHYSSTLSGDYVFIHVRLLESGSWTSKLKTNIYKSFHFVGYIISDTVSTYYDFAVCNDYFVRLTYSHFSKPAKLRLQAYSRRSGHCQLYPCKLSPSVHLTGREILGWKSTSDEKTVLICMETKLNKIVIITLPDGTERATERAVWIDGIGQLDRFDFHAHPAWSSDHLAVDKQQLSILWTRNKTLHLIDLVKGEEVWRREDLCLSSQRSNYYGTRMIRTKVYTCIASLVVLPTRREVLLYSNDNGQLVNCYSLRTALRIDRFVATDNAVTFIDAVESSHSLVITVNNIMRGRVPKLERRDLGSPRCHGSSCLLSEFLGVVRGRIIVTSWWCSLCQCRVLAAFDLLAEPPSLAILDRPHVESPSPAQVLSGCCFYRANTPRGEVLCTNKFSNAYEILKFG